PEAAWRRRRRTDLNRDAAARQYLAEGVLVGVIVPEVDRHARGKCRRFRKPSDACAFIGGARLDFVDEPAVHRLDALIESSERFGDLRSHRGPLAGLAIVHCDGQAFILDLDAFDAYERPKMRAHPLEIDDPVDGHGLVPRQSDLGALLTGHRQTERPERRVEPGDWATAHEREGALEGCADAFE